MAKIKHQGTGKLFDNPVLEQLTHTHISLPLVIFGGVSGALLYYGVFEKGFEMPMMGVLFLLGFIVFTLVEYLSHRYVYHIAPTNKVKEKVAYTMHGIHHEYPKDKSRLAMPPFLSLALATFFFILYRAMMGDYAFGFTAGFVFGYGFYIAVHYSIHAFRVPNNIFQTWWIHHSIHHYKEPDRAYGVTSTVWDHIFGTMPRTYYLKKKQLG